MADVVEPEGRKIIVAVDDGEESTYALQWCLRNIVSSSETSSGARDTLVLVYARPTPPLFSAMDGTGVLFSEEITASLDKYSRDLADSVMEKAQNICKNHSNVKVEVKVTIGDARDVICTTVDRIKADILVMGSHGYGFIKRFTFIYCINPNETSLYQQSCTDKWSSQAYR
ncbi:Adenine nucleotide alpha hydrolases-like superfamily protein [Rhynchospora pubera]|uniref:Adenine nucleotide alpha hydrolases-like superfamily protein n=1 Tax=Rhynchospora pubera TaxID=906938 RepID=A0AAV8CDU9_9POAL|nr:Adenine nucleotide alpha hydrolases-like superfamily protein [Rhynchospora pubera]